MPKIILFTDSLGAGGAQRQLVGLAVLLKERGYDVLVGVYQDFPFHQDYLRGNGVPFVLIPNAANSLFRIPKVIQFLKSQNPDWVIAYQESPSALACLALIFGVKYRLIVSERNTTQKVNWRDRIRFLLFRKANWIVPNSYSQAEFLIKYNPLFLQKIKVIPNYVNLEIFKPVEKKERQALQVIVVASIWPPKNTLGFIKAMDVATKKCKPFLVSWYGLSKNWIEYSNRAKTMIEELNLQSCFELKEKTSEIEKVYQNADVFCLPSFYEGTPNVICEAMASGLPILCSDICDNSRYVKEGLNGFLFNPNFPESIASAFEKFFSLSKSDRIKMGQESRRIAEELFDKDLFVNEYIKLIEGQLISNPNC